MESENERFVESCKNCHYIKDLEIANEHAKELKDRIAELEKEIEENAFYSKGYADGIKNTYEVVIPNKLKQFAERLKEKLFDLGNIVNDNDIDETLKEFIK